MQPVCGRHCFIQSGVAFVRKSRSDDRRQQGTPKDSASAKTNGRLPLFQHRGKLYNNTVCHFGARFSAAWWSRCSHASANSSYSFSTAGGWKRQRRRSWKHAFAVFCASWDVPAAGTRLRWDDKCAGVASTSISSRVSGKSRKKRDNALQIIHKSISTKRQN